jgi:hypothetical protein
VIRSLLQNGLIGKITTLIDDTAYVGSSADARATIPGQGQYRELGRQHSGRTLEGGEVEIGTNAKPRADSNAAPGQC